jgi:ribosomal protein S18 acetylase RimI-like enzyme
VIRPATPDDAPAIGRAMAQAFEDDPVAAWYWRDARRRRENLNGWFELIASIHYLDRGEVLVAEEGGEVAGCAMWAAPGAWRFSPRDELRVTRHVLPRLGWRAPIASVAMRQMERRHPERPHWYLSTLGVRPDRQGGGLGSRLMFETLARCDRDRVPAYLESSSEGSRALYERHGFETAEVLRLPRGGPPLWLMWRPPAASPQE